MLPSFVHLHVHSEYSLRDSIIRVPDKPDYGDPARAPKPNLVSRAVELGMPALALTDQANLFALVKFYKAAQANGIKPIIGCDLWIADPEDANRPHRLTVLCQDRAGYLNLSRLVSRAYVEGRRSDHAQVDPAWFDDTGTGLIALAGRESDIGRLLLTGNDEAATARAQWWQARLGDRLYLEITRAQRPDEETFLAAAVDLAEALALPVVASNDVRFLASDDFDAHEARVCIHAGRVLADPRRPRDYTPEQYLKSPEQMAVLFADLPEALSNTVEVAQRCNLELEFGTYHLPAFPTPAEHTLQSWIGSQSHDGLAGRLERHGLAHTFTREDYEARLQAELDVIGQMGFPGYFLIVADFINWAKQNGIPVGPGRGSGAGSLVAWALGITDLDPLRYGLLFERFLNPERVSMPDFDVDFCMDRRDEVIDYVAAKYGRDRVSQIITYGTMAAKAVLRDAGRVLSMPYGQVDRIAKLIPNRPLDLSLEDALGRTEKSRKEPERVATEFKELYAEDSEAQELIDLALKLEGITRNAGKHAGGVVIAPGPLSDYAPLYCEAGGDGVVTQFDKDDVESVGLVKFDFLGLRTLTIIDWAVKAINVQRARAGEPMLDIAALPTDDPAVFALLCRAQTVAVFQLESRGMQSLLKDAQPDRFEDIIALVSLYRPGPMDLIPSFCARKHGREQVIYPDARVEPVLRETYGIMVYQEQVMQMAQIVGSYTLGGADLLRRAMGKKNVAEMAKQRETFRAGAAGNGLDAERADAIFDQMEKFAGYGFNKSHAAAYALVAYQTAWLKAHYPAQFMAAVLSADMDNTDKIVTFLAETRSMGMAVRPPDINVSDHHFVALADGAIQYGLGAIKGVGQGAIETIIQARTRAGAYVDLADFCRRADGSKINKRVLEALIQSGAMDALGANRASLMAQMPEAIRAADQHARDAAIGQHDIFGAASAAPLAPPTLIEVPEWPLERKLLGERETLGHYLSGHPTDAWRDLIARVATCPIGQIEKFHKPPQGEQRNRFIGQPFVLAGQVGNVRKRGDNMGFVQIEDASGRVEASLFREAWAEYSSLLTRDAILVFEGGLSIDDFSGGYQLRVQRISSIETACERHAQLLQIRTDGIDAGFARRLLDALTGFLGGPTPVRIAYANANGQGEIELGPQWRVRACAALTHAVQQLGGVEQAELVYGPDNSASGRA